MIRVIDNMYDFYKYRKTSKKPLVCYGAGGVGNIYCGVVNSYYRIHKMRPDYFCDLRADKIGCVNTRQDQCVSVVSPAEIKQISGGVDVLITLMNAASELENIVALFTDADFDMTFCKIEFGGNYTLMHTGEAMIVCNYPRYIRNYFEMIQSAYSCMDGCSPEYLTATLAEAPGLIIGDSFLLSHMESAYVNCAKGVRKTSFTQAGRRHKLYVFGDSRTYGTYSEDDYTYCSCLQKQINSDPGISFEVVNCGHSSANYAYLYHWLIHTEIEKGDVVFFAHSFYFPDAEVQFLRDADDYCQGRGAQFVFINMPLLFEAYHSDEEKVLNSLFTVRPAIGPAAAVADQTTETLHRLRERRIRYWDLRETLLRRNRAGRDSFYVDFIHFGSNGNIWIADELFQCLKCLMAADRNAEEERAKQKTYGEFLESLGRIREQSGMDAYIAAIAARYKNPNSADAGAVVMNCNPFTRGHLHLVEQALAQSDFLYIFVVEEDRSEFPFVLRFRLVKEGVAHLKNVAVIPSGQFIASSMTFPGYFNRDDSKGDVADAWDDLMIFAVNIAPPMGIRKRFVGEEPFSAITNHYHRQMKTILPRYGVEVIEIPRVTLEADETHIISASTARRLMKERHWDLLRRYVPESTFTCLKEMAASNG